MQVRATGITPAELTWDETYQNADGTPRIPSTLGHEISGMVERMADDVPDFRIGNEVYGLVDFPRDGAAAEFAAVRAINLALMLNAPLPNLVLPLPIDNRFKARAAGARRSAGRGPGYGDRIRIRPVGRQRLGAAGDAAIQKACWDATEYARAMLGAFMRGGALEADQPDGHGPGEPAPGGAARGLQPERT